MGVFKGCVTQRWDVDFSAVAKMCLQMTSVQISVIQTLMTFSILIKTLVCNRFFLTHIVASDVQEWGINVRFYDQNTFPGFRTYSCTTSILTTICHHRQHSTILANYIPLTGLG